MARSGWHHVGVYCLNCRQFVSVPDNPNVSTSSSSGTRKIDGKLKKVLSEIRKLSSASVTVGERKRIAEELAGLGVLLTSYSEEQTRAAKEMEETFNEALHREALWKGIEITGAYPDYEAHHQGVAFPISVVEPNRIAFVDGKRVDGATPEALVKRIIESKPRPKSAVLGDVRQFSTVFSQACQVVSNVTGQSNVKLIHVFAVVRAAYQARKVTVNEIRLLEKGLGDGLIHLELHPGSDLRDAVPLRYEGIKRNVVWVKLVRE